MTTKRCSDPLNRGCVTILRRDNDDGVCGACEYAERQAYAAQQRRNIEARDRRQAVLDYLQGHTASPSMIGGVLAISFTEVKRYLQQLQAEGLVRKVKDGGPGKAAAYTATQPPAA